MTQEEKARAYDKAIEKIKYVMEHGVSPTLNKEDLQDIFPELVESEDEKIRKELIDYINRLTVTPNNIDRYNSWIAWLEKQVQSTTITIPKDLKGTDTDGGVVGEKGEQGEQPTEEEMVGMGELGKAWKEDSKEDAIIARLDKIYDLLLGRLPVFYPNYPFPYNPIIYKNQLDPDPNEPCGWETTASTEGGEE